MAVLYTRHLLEFTPEFLQEENLQPAPGNNAQHQPCTRRASSIASHDEVQNTSRQDENKSWLPRLAGSTRVASFPASGTYSEAANLVQATSSGHLSADMEPNVCRRGSLHSSNSLVSKAVSDCRDVHGFQGSTETSLERLKVQNCAEDVEGQHAGQHGAHEASEATDSLQQFPAAATALPGPTESVCCC